jgi:hypothetical protein
MTNVLHRDTVPGVTALTQAIEEERLFFISIGHNPQAWAARH